MAYLCVFPACGSECSGCNHAISPDEIIKYAVRYAYIRGNAFWCCGRADAPEELDKAIDYQLQMFKEDQCKN